MPGIESLTEVLVTELRDRQLGEKPRGKACAGMRGIIEEGDEHAGEEYETEALRDAVIIGAAMRVEHYEMAAYMGAIEHARILGQSTVRDLLEETLAEEQATDKKLQAIGQAVNPAAASGDDEEEEGGGLGGMIARFAGGGNGRGSNGRGGNRKRGGSQKSGRKRGGRRSAKKR